ncbi:MAG: monofunctional biosynthetic peptidoglycan transglycosylase [Candidatus Cryptobacteroides sp.]
MKRFLSFLFLYVPLVVVVLSLLWVMMYRVVPVTWTPLMLKRSIENVDSEGFRNRRVWVDIDDVAPVMVRAVIASEDGRFMAHNGFDFEEIRKMRMEHESKGKKIRGCSTISQQVAKNCFTFGSRTWLRKGVEAYFTFLIEKLWGKQRIMEVYLNVAEMGKGIYGVEAAAMTYFGCHASQLTTSQAVCIACVLPNPLVRNPRTVPQKNRTKYNTTYSRTEKTPYPFTASGKQ